MPHDDRLFTLLEALSDDELQSIWVDALRRKPDAKEYAASTREMRIEKISAEWRAAHGHTIANRFRGPHELAWKRILIDVADKLRPGVKWTRFRMSDPHPEDEIEREILRFYDERVRSRWNRMSAEEQERLARSVDEELDAASRALSSTIDGLAARNITVSTLSKAVCTGLLTGGGALALAKGAIGSAMASTLGSGILYQVGLWIAGRVFGQWASLKLVILGGAAQVGARFLAWPIAIVLAAEFFMSTSYRKSVAATLALLSFHELRRQLSE